MCLRAKVKSKQQKQIFDKELMRKQKVKIGEMSPRKIDKSNFKNIFFKCMFLEKVYKHNQKVR